MKLTPNFYRDRVCLNVWRAAKTTPVKFTTRRKVTSGRRALQNYPDVASAVADMRDYAKLIDNALSVGLGAGDPNQSAMVSEISRRAAAARQQSSPAWLPAARCSAERDGGQRHGLSHRYAGNG